MYHLDNNSGVATRPDIPTVLSTQPRWFTEGGNGTSPSYPGAHWFNIVQGELLGVLSAAGITPQKHQLNQVTQAIQNLIRQGVSGKAEASHTHGIAQITGLSDALNGLSQKAGEAKTAADVAHNFAREKSADLDNRKLDKIVEKTINLDNLDPDKWYPIVLKMPNVRKLYRFAVRRTLLDGNNPPWSTHDAGFVVYCEWETQPSGWGTYPQYEQMRMVSQFTFSYCAQSPILSIGQISEASCEYCYLRGGANYTLSYETGVTVELGSNGYMWRYSNPQYNRHLPVITAYDASLVPKTSRKVLQDAIDTKVNKAGDTMTGKLFIEGLANGTHGSAGIGLCNLGGGKGTGVHYDGHFHNSKTNKGGMHIVDAGNGASEVAFLVTPDGDTGVDRRHLGALVDKNGALWAKAYGWLHDYFPKRADMVGQVAYFAMSTAPSGWLKANGAAVSRTTYADLFAKIGTRYGVGDGRTTFNLPDLRGEFVRGWDDGRNVDAGRVLGSMQLGSAQALNAGNAMRSLGIGNQDNNTASIWHRAQHDKIVAGQQGYQEIFGSYNNIFSWHGRNGHGRVKNGNDNIEFGAVRPRNIALLACIKY